MSYDSVLNQSLDVLHLDAVSKHVLGHIDLGLTVVQLNLNATVNLLAVRRVEDVAYGFTL